LIEISSGSALSVYGGRMSYPAEGSLDTTPNQNWIDIEQLKPEDTNVLMVRDAAGGEDIDNVGGVAVNFATVDRNDSDFTVVDSDTFRVERTGYYRLSYSIATKRTANDGTRIEAFAVPVINGQQSNVCWSQAFNRGVQGTTPRAYNFTQNKASCIVYLTASDSVEIHGGRSSSNSRAIITMADKSWFYMQSLDVINEPAEIISLVNPPNESTLTNGNIDFNFTADDDQGSMICALYGDFTGSWDHIINISGVGNNTLTNISWSVSDGNHNWNIMCQDEYGFGAFYQYNYTFVLDGTPPSISLASWNVSSTDRGKTVKFNVSLTDDHTITLRNITIKVPNGTSKHHGLSSAGGNEYELIWNNTNNIGIYNVTHIIVQDSFGNYLNQTSDVTFESLETPPTEFDLLTPGDGISDIEWQPTLTWEQTTDNEFQNYTIQISTDQLFATIDFTYSNALITDTDVTLPAQLENGTTYYWRVQAYDSYGSQTISTSTYQYNVLARKNPAVSFVSPTTQTYAGNIVINTSINATNTNIASAEYRIINSTTDLTGWQTLTLTGGDTQTGHWTTNFDTSTIPDGTYNISINTTDNFGLKNQSEYREFNTDNTAPSMGAKYLNASGNVNMNSSICINVTGISDASGISSVYATIQFPNATVQYHELQDVGVSCAGVGSDGWYGFEFSVSDVLGTLYFNAANATDLAGISTLNSSPISIIVSDYNPPTIQLAEAEELAVINGDAIVNYNVSDDNNIENCSMYIGGLINSTNSSIFTVDNSFSITNLGVGRYNYSVTCNDEFGNSQNSGLKYLVSIYTGGFDGITTNFTLVNLTGAENLTLEKVGNGIIKYNSIINISGGINFGDAIALQDNFISVDSTNYPQLNKSATIGFYNLNYAKNPVLFRGSAICTDCPLLNYVDGNANFSISHFSNFTATGNSNMSIYDEVDPEGGGSTKFAFDTVNFWANYTNKTSGITITGANVTCQFDSEDTPKAFMNYNSSNQLYEISVQMNSTGFFA